jgi:hypothetical protein
MKKPVIKHSINRNLFRLKPKQEQRRTLLGAVILIILLYGLADYVDYQEYTSVELEQ